MNITYLLGAGASYYALPVVNQISDKLQHFENELGTFLDPNEQRGKHFINTYGHLNIAGEKSPAISTVLNELKEDVAWLRKENAKHYSIDTLARKLYLKQDFKTLLKLKVILANFFAYLQNMSFDYRYDSFFASILEEQNNLPPNIKIASWNYGNFVFKSLFHCLWY